jgi:alpha-beta hydrolase superfamily lysophospholipase
MKTTTFSLHSSEGQDIVVYKWQPENISSYQGILQLAHGMAEHAGRYHDFAGELCKAGFIVYASDHRGHGKTAGNLDNFGYIGQNGWEQLIKDIYSLTRFTKKEYPELPIFLFGHSMGSFLVRNYLFDYGKELKGVILSGTGGDPGILAAIGKFIAMVICRTRGERYRSKLLHNLTFGNYNKRIKDPRTKYDWLSRDKKVVDDYIDDDYCGGVFTASFFYEIASGLQEINKKENLGRIPVELPILLVSGTEDPVGNYTKGVLQVYQNFRKAGIKDVRYKLYEGARHEVLNETNKREVYRDVLAWLSEHLANN